MHSKYIMLYPVTDRKHNTCTHAKTVEPLQNYITYYNDEWPTICHKSTYNKSKFIKISIMNIIKLVALSMAKTKLQTTVVALNYH